MARRRRLSWYLVVAFVLLPILELFLLIQLGQAIGAGWVIALVIAGCVLGSVVARTAGARAWHGLRTALETGEMADDRLADGALMLLGGLLLVVPGPITDVVGLLLILPFTRPLFRGLLARSVGRRLRVIGPLGPTPGPGRAPFGPTGPVVRGEVVDE